MNKDSKIYIAGHKGMVGSAIWRNLEKNGYTQLIGKSSSDLDLRNQAAVNDFFATTKPDIVIDAAARVGGILANSEYPYNFLMENLQIQNNLIDAAHKNDIQKFIFLGSSCIYPKHAPQPLKEEYLLTDSLEPTNEWYAIAKIAGVKACEAIRKQYNKDFVSLMPTNLYGPNDNFDLKTSHVLPAMIRKFHEAKFAIEEKTHQTGQLRNSPSGGEKAPLSKTKRQRRETGGGPSNHAPVHLWGSGTPLREFLHVHDLAEATRFAVENKLEENLYNIGTGKDLTIKALAETIQEIVGHKGEIIWDSSKPDGTPRKLMDVSKMAAQGWEAKIELKDGIQETYDWFLENENNIKEISINKD